MKSFSDQGKLLWTQRFNNVIKLIHYYHSKIILYNDDTIYCINTETGAILWQTEIAGTVRATAEIPEGLLIFTSLDSDEESFDYIHSNSANSTIIWLDMKG